MGGGRGGRGIERPHTYLFQVSCYCCEGIGAVKTALTSGISHSAEDMPIKINLIAYVMTTTMQHGPYRGCG